MSEINAVLPKEGRDLRLDLFRGIANWAIFLDHIPNNLIAWVTTRNYGFSDAADLFVFISGYTAAFVYARVMLSRGFIIGAAKLLKRVWQLYVAHVLLFILYIAAIGWAAQRFNEPALLHEFNVAGLSDNPTQTIVQGLLLRFKPVNLDVLPLYIVLMLVFPPILWCMLRQPDLTLLASIAVYFAARAFGWNLASFPGGTWYFNPFTWQLLFMSGAWFALGGALSSRPVIRSQWLIYVGGAYLLFALVLTLAGEFRWLAAMIPQPVFEAFNPNDKTNLAPYRFIHFIVIAFMLTRFIPRDWPGLEKPIFDPMIKCGQHSLEVFCAGIFLSFIAHLSLMLFTDAYVRGHFLMQLFVSVAGIALLCAVAYFKEWGKRLDAKPAKVQADGVTPVRQIGPSILTRQGKDKAAADTSTQVGLAGSGGGSLRS
jgi:hypothetical protein